ncbi:hypothetical protein CDAR_395321 [Caerostris darwini]|uniref:Uncharacterized protein n=1 Tax=Caerostris darwini TaxID=1538125 RepID=A0AAV4QEE2_9ARAC|nr:hypothetical protein CDAR_395321 [Caerostris darwini]
MPALPPPSASICLEPTNASAKKVTNSYYPIGIQSSRDAKITLHLHIPFTECSSKTKIIVQLLPLSLRHRRVRGCALRPTRRASTAREASTACATRGTTRPLRPEDLTSIPVTSSATRQKRSGHRSPSPSELFWRWQSLHL